MGYWVDSGWMRDGTRMTQLQATQIKADFFRACYIPDKNP